MVWNYTIPQVFKYWRFIDIINWAYHIYEELEVVWEMISGVLKSCGIPSRHHGCFNALLWSSMTTGWKCNTAATSKTIPSLIFANGTHYSTSWRHSHQIKQILNISKMEWVVVNIAQMWVWRLTFGSTKVWLSCGLFEDIFLAQSQTN